MCIRDRDDDTTTISASELNVLDGVTPGTVTPDKVIVVDSNKDIATIRDLTASGILTGGSLEIDDILIDGNKIGPSEDPDLTTLKADTLLVAGTVAAAKVTGDGSELTGVLADSIGVLSGVAPLVLEGATMDDNETTISLEDPTTDRTITLPDVSGTVITTGNDGSIDAVGTIGSGTWEGTAVGDPFVVDDLTITDGTVNSTVIGGITPAAGTFTSVTSTGGVQANGTLSLDDGTATITASELNVLDGVTAGIVADDKALVVDRNKDIGIIRNLTASDTVTAGVFVGSASGLTGIQADSIAVLSGASPLVLEGSTDDDSETTIMVTDPTEDRTITLPNTTGTVITTGNMSSITSTGTITEGTWQGKVIVDTYLAGDLTISGGTIDSTVIGGSTPASGTFTSVTSTGCLLYTSPSPRDRG